MRRVLAFALLCLLAVEARADWEPKIPDLSVEVLAAAQACAPGQNCTIYVRVANEGNGAFDGDLALRLATTLPVTLSQDGAHGWACLKQSYISFACGAEAVSLDVHRFVDIPLTLRAQKGALPTIKICAAIDWRLQGGTIEQQARANAAAAYDVPAKTWSVMANLVGTWGAGDPVAVNDRHCLDLNLGKPPSAPACAAGQNPLAGSCVTLARECSGGRSWDEKAGRCACPKGQSYDASTRACKTQSALYCSAERTASGGFCLCPGDRPVWNVAKSQCEGNAHKAVAQVEIKRGPAVTQQPRRDEPPPPRRAHAPVRKAHRQTFATFSPAPIERRAPKQRAQSVARFSPCPGGYHLGPLGRRCWPNTPGAGTSICAAGRVKSGVFCVRP
jgi:hypothetical protein